MTSIFNDSVIDITLFCISLYHQYVNPINFVLKTEKKSVWAMFLDSIDRHQSVLTVTSSYALSQIQGPHSVKQLEQYFFLYPVNQKDGRWFAGGTGLYFKTGLKMPSKIPASKTSLTLYSGYSFRKSDRWSKYLDHFSSFRETQKVDNKYLFSLQI